MATSTANKSEKEETGLFRDSHSARKISIWIDLYDDIFSDFDPRPLSSRNISDDFIREVKKVSFENEAQVKELLILVPETLRNPETELIIMKRLHSFFVKNQHYYQKRRVIEVRSGTIFTFIGLALMFCASLISSEKSDKLWMHFMLILCEPGGWFLVWVGMENLVNLYKKEKPEFDFYSKMSKSKIAFADL